MTFSILEPKEEKKKTKRGTRGGAHRRDKPKSSGAEQPQDDPTKRTRNDSFPFVDTKPKSADKRHNKGRNNSRKSSASSDNRGEGEHSKGSVDTKRVNVENKITNNKKPKPFKGTKGIAPFGSEEDIGQPIDRPKDSKPKGIEGAAKDVKSLKEKGKSVDSSEAALAKKKPKKPKKPKKKGPKDDKTAEISGDVKAARLDEKPQGL